VPHRDAISVRLLRRDRLYVMMTAVKGVRRVRWIGIALNHRGLREENFDLLHVPGHRVPGHRVPDHPVPDHLVPGLRDPDHQKTDSNLPDLNGRSTEGVTGEERAVAISATAARPGAQVRHVLEAAREATDLRNGRSENALKSVRQHCREIIQPSPTCKGKDASRRLLVPQNLAPHPVVPRRHQETLQPRSV